MSVERRHRIAAGSPVVVKAGTSSLVKAGGRLDDEALRTTVGHVVGLAREGYKPVLVSSGAVAAGMPALGLEHRPTDVPGLQAAAAVGQGLLMERYATLFAEEEMVVGQILLTKDLLASRLQYLHARDALQRLLSLGVVPIINENDTVVVDELRLGDNDRLAAVVSHLVNAGILVILTDTRGLYSADPRVVEEPELLTAVHATDLALDEVAGGASGPFGSGGAATKVAAARMAAWSGIPTVIADAGQEGVVASAVNGDEVGTWVAPHPERLAARKLWIAFGQRSEGRIIVDAGAAEALIGQGKSLLAVGVTSVEGEFEAGAAVDVVDEMGVSIGKGVIGLGSSGAREAVGKHSSEVGVLIHRDDFVRLAPPPVSGARLSADRLPT
ncbi:MAG: glutamate 5-kinase [Acidimicrobiia bacterium]